MGGHAIEIRSMAGRGKAVRRAVENPAPLGQPRASLNIGCGDMAAQLTAVRPARKYPSEAV